MGEVEEREQRGRGAYALLQRCDHGTPLRGCAACWERVMAELAGCASTLGVLHDAVGALFHAAKGGDYDKAVTDLGAAYNAVHSWARDCRRTFANGE